MPKQQYFVEIEWGSEQDQARLVGHADVHHAGRSFRHDGNCATDWWNSRRLNQGLGMGTVADFGAARNGPTFPAAKQLFGYRVMGGEQAQAASLTSPLGPAPLHILGGAIRSIPR